MSRRARQMRKLLYPLQRERGEKLQIHQINKNKADLENGVIDKSYMTYKVKKAIVMPVNQTRSFVYDLAYIAANKNFTGGGLFDKASTTCIIDMRELPTGFVIDLNDYCSISGVTYKIAASDVLEDAFYIVKLQTLSNFPTLEV